MDYGYRRSVLLYKGIVKSEVLKVIYKFIKGGFTPDILAGHLEESIDDFRQCTKVPTPMEHDPLVHWIYSPYVELGKFDEAEKSLELIDATLEPPRMDYGYCRSVRLYKPGSNRGIDIPPCRKRSWPGRNAWRS